MGLLGGRHFLAEHRAGEEAGQGFGEAPLRGEIGFGEQRAVRLAVARRLQIARQDLVAGDVAHHRFEGAGAGEALRGVRHVRLLAGRLRIRVRIQSL